MSPMLPLVEYCPIQRPDRNNRDFVLAVRELVGGGGGERRKSMASQQEREELDRRAREGETVVPGGTGGKSLEAQEHLAEGRSKGGQTRKEQLGTEGYQEMGRKGGLSTGDESGGERAAHEGVQIDESKFRTRS